MSAAFHEPTTIAEAVAILATEPDVCCLAGGQSLVAALNTRSFAAPTLVSLQRIEELRGLRRGADGSVTVGAMTTHRDVARADCFQAGQEIVPQAAAHIAHPAVRTMGTIGGSICHADPAADYPGVLAACGATVTLVNARGQRELAASDFFVDFLTTAVEPDEMVTAITFPPMPEGTRGIYEKFCRSEGDFATVSVALILGMHDGRCAFARVALGGCGPTPVRAPEAETRLIGSRLDDDDISSASNLLCSRAAPQSDVRGSAEYRLMLVPRLLVRALDRARRRP